MIDTHCHLTFPDFAGRTAVELDLCLQNGVTGCITISTTTHDCTDALRIARAHDRVWCSAGVHPLYSDQHPHDWARLRLVASDPKCVAWGELGLDNHYKTPPSDVQHAVLAEQIGLIARWESDASSPVRRLPIVLHCREAFDDLIPILRASPFDPARFVFHCFTGTPADMRKVLDFGAMVSFTGVVSYRNATDLRNAALLPPADRIMVETDAPFLAPEPHRGRRPCRPAWVRHVAEALATLRSEPFHTFHDAINANTARFFGIPAR